MKDLMVTLDYDKDGKMKQISSTVSTVHTSNNRMKCYLLVGEKTQNSSYHIMKDLMVTEELGVFSLLYESAYSLWFLTFCAVPIRMKREWQS